MPMFLLLSLPLIVKVIKYLPAEGNSLSQADDYPESPIRTVSPPATGKY